ncbi:ribonuclease HII [Halococcus saccharolyticus]|uniref:Ribonuclease HII n=1 Tax=Halococcus saccharolyticus DSM 5350 TaxID=1227455 RepID=M0MBH1_9EURY|nr:ribonuclease HII [Halococcus saccharolyticus]EMA43122.1 ribonuclease HII [Halococcus saccharolyticus DSM 5350]
MERSFGVDEAGRGPVLGSLFVACVRADPAALPAGIDDSKRLSPARRETIAGELRDDDRISIATREVTPSEIDAPDTDLNALTIAAAGAAIDGVVSVGADAEAAADRMAGVIDACDTDAERFGRRVREATTADVAITAEHGADEEYDLVGAASVVAKVARDAHIADLADEHGSVGSGYPSDPTTRDFLARYVHEHGDLPPFARRSWKTSREALAAAEQSALAEF